MRFIEAIRRKEKNGLRKKFAWCKRFAMSQTTGTLAERIVTERAQKRARLEYTYMLKSILRSFSVLRVDLIPTFVFVEKHLSKLISPFSEVVDLKPDGEALGEIVFLLKQILREMAHGDDSGVSEQIGKLLDDLILE
jgi:hypothetical protein